MKINIEFTIDEFCGIKSEDEGGSDVNYHHFYRIGNRESIEKENLKIRNGEFTDSFLFMTSHVVYVKIVKEHSKIDIPPKALVRSKANSRRHRKKKLTVDKNKKRLKRLKHKNRFGKLNND